MPKLVFYLTGDRRKLLAKIAAVLHFVAACISLALAVYSVLSCYFTYSNILYLVRRENPIVGVVPLVNAILCSVLLLLHVLGCLFSLDQRLKETRWSMVGLLREVAMLETGALLIAFVSALFNLGFVINFSGSFSSGMAKAMTNLASNSTPDLAGHDKYALDWVQFKYQCCARDGYRDWLTATEFRLSNLTLNDTGQESWKNQPCGVQELHLQTSSGQPVSEEETTEGEFSCFIPFSCCRWDRRDCFSSYLLMAPTRDIATTEEYTDYISDADGLFNDEGCPSAVTDWYPPWIPLLAFGVLVLFECGTASLTQLVQSSVACANRMRIRRPVAPGWLIPFWGAKKQTLIQRALKTYHPRHYHVKDDKEVLEYGADITFEDERVPPRAPHQLTMQLASSNAPGPAGVLKLKIKNPITS